MEFTNEFTVPTDVDTALAVLTDLEKVAPCLPGAQLEEVDGDVYTGRVKVKVGPISMTYRGQAELAETDTDAKQAHIRASGKETRGTGTAKADVHARLRPEGDGTVVTVVTDLTVTGKPAQFGRGVMAEVGSKIIDTFAERLRTMLEQEQAEGEAVATPASPAAEVAMAGASAEAVLDSSAPSGTAGPGATGSTTAGAASEAVTPPVSSGPRRIAQDPSREDDALDLMDVAGAATLKRVAPLVGLVALVVAFLLFRRRRAG